MFIALATEDIGGGENCARGIRTSSRGHEFHAGHISRPTRSKNSNVAALKKRYNSPEIKRCS